MPCGGIGNEWKTQVSKFLDSVFRSAYYANLNIEQVKVFESIMFQLLYLSLYKEDLSSCQKDGVLGTTKHPCISCSREKIKSEPFLKRISVFNKGIEGNVCRKK